MEQVHKRFTDDQVKEMIERYLKKEIERAVEAYRKIALHTLQLRVNNARPRQKVTVRMYPQEDGVTELRVWSEFTLLDVQRVKTVDLKTMHF